MRMLTLVILVLVGAAALAGDDGRQTRAPKLEWRTLPLDGKSAQQAKQHALEGKGVVARRAPEAVPLVAVPRADGSLELRHRRRQPVEAPEPPAEPRR